MYQFWGAWLAQLVEASDFSSGHDLVVPKFQPCVGLCADSSEPGASFRFCVSLSLPLSGAHTLSLSKINKHKIFFPNVSVFNHRVVGIENYHFLKIFNVYSFLRDR